jgi:hypothetical protein
MATAPTSPLTWTALPAADATIGPDVAYVIANSGTFIACPRVEGAFVFTTTEITFNVSEIDWDVIESDDEAVIGSFLWGSIDTDKALALYGSTLVVIEGA